MQDLSLIQNLSTAEVQLTHPVTGKLLDAYFTLLGPEDSRRKAWNQANRGAMVQKLFGTPSPEDDDTDEKDREHLLLAVTGWRTAAKPNVIVVGQEISYSPDALGALIDDPKYAWIRAWLNAKLASASVFIRDSSPTSAAGTPGVSPNPEPAAAAEPAPNS